MAEAHGRHGMTAGDNDEAGMDGADDAADDRVTVEEVLADETHGSSWLAVRALEALASAARAASESPDGGWTDVAARARRLRAGRPAMTVLRNRVDRAMARADRDPASVAAAAEAVREEAAGADEEAAELSAERIAGRRVLTVSRSETVLTALRRGAPEAVLVTASEPGGEGRGVATALAGESAVDAEVTLLPDAGVAQGFADGAADSVLLGADRVLPDGSVVNKVGSRAAALAASREGQPVLAVTSVDKIDASRARTEDPSAEYDAPDGVERYAPMLDRTPPDLLDAVLTERGALLTDDVATVAEELAGLSGWLDED